MMPMKTPWTCGTDPEMMLIKDGKLVAVQQFIQGTKTEPQPLKCGGTLQKDNALLEFATPVARNKVELVEHMAACFNEVFNILPKGVDVLIQPSADYPEEELQHPETQEFFCEPDFNAWTMGMNEAPEGFEAGTFRSAGAHVHIGHVEGSGNEFLLDYEGKLDTIRTCDVTLGLASTMLDNSVAALARRKLYGKPGCYRETEYGVEYRTLSNFWIKSPVYVMWVHSFVDDVLNIVREKNHNKLIGAISPNRIQSTIMKGDQDMANFLMDKHINQYLSDESKQRFEDSKILSAQDIDFKAEWEGVKKYVSDYSGR